MRAFFSFRVGVCVYAVGLGFILGKFSGLCFVLGLGLGFILLLGFCAGVCKICFDWSGCGGCLGGGGVGFLLGLSSSRSSSQHYMVAGIVSLCKFATTVPTSSAEYAKAP